MKQANSYLERSLRGRFVALLGATLLAGAALLLAAPPTQANTFGYATQRQQIRCGIVITSDDDNDYAVDDYTPYVFYIMDRRTDLKPAGWEFVNPLAPAVVTPDGLKRMIYRGSHYLQEPGMPKGALGDPNLDSPLVQLNARLTKNMSAYWETNLSDLTYENITQYDVLLISMRPGNTSEPFRLTPDESAKLRHFVDGGGTLWIEDEGGMGNYPLGGVPPAAGGSGDYLTQNFLIPFRFFSPGNTGGSPTLAVLQHPLVSYPFPISPSEAGGVGANHVGGSNHMGMDGGLPGAAMMSTVLWNNGNPYVSAGDFGAGHIVISSAGAATGISTYCGGVALARYGGNSGVISGESILNARTLDLKFSYNMCAWATSVATGAADVRRTGTMRENVGARVAGRWQSIPIDEMTFGGPEKSTSPGNAGSGVILYKGLAMWVGGNNVLYAYKVNPTQDLDLQGNPDNGIPDIPGAPFDLVWKQNLNALAQGNAAVAFSTPSAFTVTKNGQPFDLVAVTGTNGVTYVFNAFSRSNSGKLLGAAVQLFLQEGTATDQSTLNGPPADLQPIPPSPAFSEGVLFGLVNVVAAAGTPPPKLWNIAAADPISGASVFKDAANNDVGAPTMSTSNLGALTAGYVKDQVTGALDKVVYFATAPLANSAPGGLQGVWFSTREEPMLPGTADMFLRARGNRGNIPWFLPAKMPAIGGLDLRPVIHDVYLNANGLVDTVVDLHWKPGGKGDFLVLWNSILAGNSVSVILANGIKPGHRYYADYVVDWAGPGVTYDNLDPNNVGNFMVGPDRAVVAAYTNRGTFQTYDTNTPNYSNGIHTGAALSANDTLIFSDNMYDVSQGSAPKVPGVSDRIYSYRDQFRLIEPGNPPTGGGAATWMFSASGGENGIPSRLVHADPATGKFFPIKEFHAVGQPAVTATTVYALGTASMNNGTVTVLVALRSNPDTSFTIGRAIPTDAEVSVSQVSPLTAGNVQPQSVTLPSLPGGQNANQWFSVDRSTGTIHINNFRSPNGDALDTSLPVRVSVDPNAPVIEVKDPVTGIGPMDNLSWFMVLPQTTPASGPSVTGNSIYFSDIKGNVVSVDISRASAGSELQAFDSNLKPLNAFIQPGLLDPVTNQLYPGLNVAYPPVAAQNTVMVPTSEGLNALQNENTLIADSTRLVQVNTVGDMVWEMETTRSAQVVGGQLSIFSGGDTADNVGLDRGVVAMRNTSFSRPTAAHLIGQNNYMVADTGNNRVVFASKGGSVIRELQHIKNDLGFLPGGAPMGLNHPTDVEGYTENLSSYTVTLPGGQTMTYANPCFAVHYLIADGGNYRCIEVVDVFDAATGTPIQVSGAGGNVVMEGQVTFATRSLPEQNLQFRYQTVQQFMDTGSAGNPLVLVAAVNNAEQQAIPGSISVGGGATSVNGPGSCVVVISRTPGVPGTDGLVTAVVSRIAFPQGGGKFAYQEINRPTWFKRIQVPDASNIPVTHYLLADANGVYEIAPSGANAVVVWSLSSKDYQNMMGRPLQASCVQRLGKADYAAGKFYPRYLITNRYHGPDYIKRAVPAASGVTAGEVHGEVFEIRGLDYYTNGNTYAGISGYAANGTLVVWSNSNPIVWMTPTETMPSASGNPITRNIGVAGSATATYLLEQPQFAERP